MRLIDGREGTGDGYISLTLAARFFGRPARSVRTWVAMGIVRSRTVAGRVLVHYDDVRRAHYDRRQRNRKHIAA